MSQAANHKYKISILFVDDEPTMLEVYRLVFKSLDENWDLQFAGGAQEALALMAKMPFHVIVSDMRMPGMNGAQLLTEVLRLYPRTARIILSGFAEQESVAKCVGAAHQFLLKPCDVMTLRSTLTRVMALDQLLDGDHLKVLVSRMGALPSLPSLYFRIIQELQSPSASLERLGNIVAQDPAMTAKVLQLVNSAFFGFPQKISNPAEAINFLGVNTVRSLALCIHAFSCFDQAKIPEFSFERVWNHSLRVGTFAKKIAQSEAAGQVMLDETFIAGLLHDLGKLMLATHMGLEYKQAMALRKERNIPICQAEQEVFGATHAHVGAYLLGLWGLPAPVVEAVALHHQPGLRFDQNFSPLIAVHAADALDHECSAEMEAESKTPLDVKFLADVGLADRIDDWRASFQEINQSPVGQ
ncbi:MAG TPA: response regulator [Verrucomicrobiae bacterium]